MKSASAAGPKPPQTLLRSPFHQSLDLPATAEIHDLPPPPAHLTISFEDLTAADRWLSNRRTIEAMERDLNARVLSGLGGLQGSGCIHPQAKARLGHPHCHTRHRALA